MKSHGVECDEKLKVLLTSGSARTAQLNLVLISSLGLPTCPQFVMETLFLLLLLRLVPWELCEIDVSELFVQRG